MTGQNQQENDIRVGLKDEEQHAIAEYGPIGERSQPQSGLVS